jgi:biotin carboxyl carrier protein
LIFLLRHRRQLLQLGFTNTLHFAAMSPKAATSAEVSAVEAATPRSGRATSTAFETTPGRHPSLHSTPTPNLSVEIAEAAKAAEAPREKEVTPARSQSSASPSPGKPTSIHSSLLRGRLLSLFAHEGVTLTPPPRKAY